MSNDSDVGRHRTIPFRPERNATVDTLRWAKKRHAVPALLEVDVTEARAAIREVRRATGEGVSFTAWVVSCVARAVSEHPRVHAVRRGRRELVLFEEVDVTVAVERSLATDGAGTTVDRAAGRDTEREPAGAARSAPAPQATPATETVPMPMVVRDAARKTPMEIHREIREAQREEVEPGQASLAGSTPGWVQTLFFRLPAFLRDLLLWRWLFRSPERIKRTMGTVAVTSVGMAAPGTLGWGIPLSVHPLAVAVGGITRRDSGDGTREILALTLVFDHDVTDGAPFGRFVRRLVTGLSLGEGLTDPG